MNAPSRVAFYVEPVVFRQNPMLLRPWLDWVASMIKAMPGRQFALCSSPWLCRAFAETYPRQTDLLPCDPAGLLQAFRMDRWAYATDLTRPDADASRNPYMERLLEHIVSRFRPDMIISFTQNRYIEALRPAVATAFAEMQPLPRLSGCRGFFFDPQGHQTASLLVTEAGALTRLPAPESELVRAKTWWTTHFERPVAAHPLRAEAVGLLKTLRQSGPVAMIAMQPPDWITFEGAAWPMTADTALMQALAALPAGWRAIATYHPEHRLPVDLEAAIAQQFPAFTPLPPHLAQGLSEIFVDQIDAVWTVSSAIGFTALICGKPLISPGCSNLSGFAARDFADAVSLCEQERDSLRRFLVCTYCHEIGQVLDHPDYLARLLAKLPFIASGTLHDRLGVA